MSFALTTAAAVSFDNVAAGLSVWVKIVFKVWILFFDFSVLVFIVEVLFKSLDNCVVVIGVDGGSFDKLLFIGVAFVMFKFIKFVLFVCCFIFVCCCMCVCFIIVCFL